MRSNSNGLPGTASCHSLSYTMSSEIAWCATIPYFPRASFLRTASTSAKESRIHRLAYTCRQACIVEVELRFIKFRLISRVYQLEPALNLRESHCLSPDSTTSATPLGDPWVRLCAVPCLAGGPSPDILAPFSLALPWVEVTSHACSGGS